MTEMRWYAYDDGGWIQYQCEANSIHALLRSQSRSDKDLEICEWVVISDVEAIEYGISFGQWRYRLTWKLKTIDGK